jgi:hypothetical protein
MDKCWRRRRKRTNKIRDRSNKKFVLATRLASLLFSPEPVPHPATCTARRSPSRLLSRHGPRPHGLRLQVSEHTHTAMSVYRPAIFTRRIRSRVRARVHRSRRNQHCEYSGRHSCRLTHLLFHLVASTGHPADSIAGHSD